MNNQCHFSRHEIINARLSIEMYSYMGLVNVTAIKVFKIYEIHLKHVYFIFSSQFTHGKAVNTMSQ